LVPDAVVGQATTKEDEKPVVPKQTTTPVKKRKATDDGNHLMSDEESSSGSDQDEIPAKPSPFSPGWSPSKQRKINRDLASNLASDPNRKPVSRYGRERTPSHWCSENEVSMLYSNSASS
jgi:hypothetical protein